MNSSFPVSRILSLALLALGTTARAQSINVNAVDRSLGNQAYAQSASTTNSFLPPAVTLETNLLSGVWSQQDQQNGTLPDGHVNSSVSIDSKVTPDNSMLLVKGDIVATLSEDTGDGAILSGSPQAIFSLIFTVADQPLAYLLSVTTINTTSSEVFQPDGTSQPIDPALLTIQQAFASLQLGNGTSVATFGEYNGNPWNDGLSGAKNGILAPGGYTFTARASDDEGFNATPTRQIGAFTYTSQYLVSFTLQVQPPVDLPTLPALNFTLGRSVLDSSFTLVYPAVVSPLVLTLQTMGDDGSWTNVSSTAGFTLGADGKTWTLVPEHILSGARSFRVQASSPFANSPMTSPVLGPVNIPQAFYDSNGTLTVVPWQALALDKQIPLGTWGFAYRPLAPDKLPANTTMTLQMATNQAGPWTDLGPMTQAHDRSGQPLMQFTTTNVPPGQLFFRVNYTAPGYFDGPSDVDGPHASIPSGAPTMALLAANSTTSLTELATIQNAAYVIVQANNCSSATVTAPAGQTLLNSPLAFASTDNCSQATLDVSGGATVVAPTLLLGPGSAAVLDGTVQSDTIVSDATDHTSDPLTANSSTPAPPQVVSNDGGSLTRNQSSAQIITADAASRIGQESSGIVAGGGGNIVAGGGGNIVAGGGGNALPGGSPQIQSWPRRLPGSESRLSGLRRERVMIPAPVQPDYTGLMTIESNYSQYAGNLFIAIAGTNTAAQGAQQFDQLAVHGRAYLAGGLLAFGLFDPNNQTNRITAFQPAIGDTFDVVVASNIVAQSAFRLQGPVWADGRFFTASIVNRNDGLQALRLLATNMPPVLRIQPAPNQVQLSYPTNYTGYTLESKPLLASTNWTAYPTSGTSVWLNATNTAQFFRLRKP